jgi:hypothetical protein
MGYLSFMSLSFLVAGAACALGPVLIHLLNRRRHRTIHWAAMDFLRKAIQKKRRVLNLRDWLLLAIRTLAVFLFGAALARPYFSRQEQAIDARQPVHAIVIVDNSLSMGYETLEGSLLELAKRKAREFIEILPRGSRMTIIPACGARDFVNVDALASRDEALDALARIEVVDRSANITRVHELARQAAEVSPEFPKQILFLSDQQQLTWQNATAADAGAGLAPIQCVSVRPSEWENTWVADLHVQDGLADMETPATVIAEIAHQGPSPRRDLQVALLSGDTTLGQQTITVEPGDARREVSFECVLGGIGPAPAAGQVAFLPLTAKITADRLPADDQRSLSVPVVAALPVVFIDEVADEDEDVIRNRLGETRHLRKLLAPRQTRGDAPRQLIKVRHLTPDAVSRDVLADARLVVIAGVTEPGAMAAVLADYVKQGGQVLLATGANFDPDAWNAGAWLDGEGLLPLRLKSALIGVTPEESPERLAPFQLSVTSMADEAIFHLADVPRADLEALYAEPFFFKAVEVDESAESLEAIATAELLRIEEEQNREPGDEQSSWVLWSDDAVEFHETLASKHGHDIAKDNLKNRLPNVLARYELAGKAAFLVSRQIGRGQVVFCSSGVLSPWNTLPKTNAVLLFDRLMRTMIENTLPNYNSLPIERFTLPLPMAEQHLTVSLHRPGTAIDEPLDVTFISAERRGVTVNGLLARGIYRVTGKRLSASAGALSDAVTWDVPIAVNGEPDESALTPVTRSEFESRTLTAAFRWVEPGGELEVAGGAQSGQSTWWWLALIVLLLLGTEMAVIATPSLTSRAVNDGEKQPPRPEAVRTQLAVSQAAP